MFRLRDFPQAMLEVHDLHVRGHLIGAEQVGIPRGILLLQCSRGILILQRLPVHQFI